MGTKQRQFTRAVEKACPGIIGELENIAARLCHPKIRTENIFPPIPVRQFDWAATDDNYEPGCPIGYGKTEAEAIDDLLSCLSGCYPQKLGVDDDAPQTS